jgi:CBS domain-containing protein
MMQRSVGEFLSRDAPLRVGPDASVREAARLMVEHECGSVLVMEGERLLGIFTDRNALRQVIAADVDPATPIRNVMTRDPDTIDVRAPLADALRMMDRFHYWHLPVTRGAAVIGVVALRDLPFGNAAGVQDELDRRHDISERMW